MAITSLWLCEPERLAVALAARRYLAWHRLPPSFRRQPFSFPFSLDGALSFDKASAGKFRWPTAAMFHTTRSEFNVVAGMYETPRVGALQARSRWVQESHASAAVASSLPHETHLHDPPGSHDALLP